MSYNVLGPRSGPVRLGPRRSGPFWPRSASVRLGPDCLGPVRCRSVSVRVGPDRLGLGPVSVRGLKMVRRPGIEPGPPAWKAGILTTELTTLFVDN